jgi:hypothetical protein
MLSSPSYSVYSQGFFPPLNPQVAELRKNILHIYTSYRKGYIKTIFALIWSYPSSIVPKVKKNPIVYALAHLHTKEPGHVK